MKAFHLIHKGTGDGTVSVKAMKAVVVTKRSQPFKIFHFRVVDMAQVHMFTHVVLRVVNAEDLIPN